MSIESDFFAHYEPKFESFESAGWTKDKNIWKLTRPLLGGKFSAHLVLDESGVVSGSLIDEAFDEEYLPLREDAPGSYALSVRAAYEELLYEIANECFQTKHFGSEQANRISNLISERFCCKPEFLWSDLPGYAVFRADGGKWFGLIGNVERAKLDSNLKNKRGETWILNIKLDPTLITELTNKKRLL